MKRILCLMTLFIFILSIGSCTTYTTVDYDDTPVYYYSDCVSVKYTHTYYYNGIICPVLYINSVPWFCYHNCWYTIPHMHYGDIVRLRAYKYTNAVRPPYRNHKPKYHIGHKHYRHHNGNNARPNDKNHNGHNGNYRRPTGKRENTGNISRPVRRTERSSIRTNNRNTGSYNRGSSTRTNNVRSSNNRSR